MKNKILYYYFLFILFLNCNTHQNNTKEIDEKIIGTWKGYLMDPDNKRPIEDLEMIFNQDGSLIYKIGKGNMQNTINMKFRTDNNILYSKDEKLQEDQTNYYIDNEKLILDYNNQKIELIKNK